MTELLSEGRNLTLKTFARVCFYLDAEIDFQTYLIEERYSTRRRCCIYKVLKSFNFID